MIPKEQQRAITIQRVRKAHADVEKVLRFADAVTNGKPGPVAIYKEQIQSGFRGLYYMESLVQRLLRRL